MRDPRSNPSNPYMKLGTALIFAAIVAIAWTSFFSSDSSLQAATRNIGGFLLISGLVMHVIGRVVRARAAA